MSSICYLSPVTLLQPDAPTFGQLIRELRTARKLSQAELGRPLTRSYISLIENDRAVPSVRTLLAIAWRLDVDPAELLWAVNRDAHAEYNRGHGHDPDSGPVSGPARPRDR